jgi:hypothetical protein
MSIFKILKGVIKKLDQYRSRFYWRGDTNKKKYRLAKWNILCRPKDQEGLCTIDLEIQNICLLSKWIVNLLNTEGIWQTLLRNKYLHSKVLTQVQAKPYDSHFWRGLTKIKNIVLSCGSFIIRDVTQIRFWEDTWVDNNPFKRQFSTIFNIVHDPHATVASVMSDEHYNISFRRALVDVKLREWLELIDKINNVTLDQGRDMFR